MHNNPLKVYCIEAPHMLELDLVIAGEEHIVKGNITPQLIAHFILMSFENDINLQ